MLDILLLRYRDITPSINTIEEHNKIVEAQGKVLWGWWKKGSEQMPDPYLYDMAKEIKDNSLNSKVYIINSGTNELYEARLFNIYYELGGKEQKPYDKDLCPAYYSSEELPAWFELGKIEKILQGLEELSQYVFSRSNRILPDNSSCLSEQEIGQIVRDVDFLEKNISLWFISKIDDFPIRKDGYAVNISNGILPTKGKYILHLSDLHFGDSHAYKNPLGSMSSAVAKQELSDILFADLKIQGISSNDIALIIISGDLTWRADPHEFSNASVFLSELKKYFGLSNKQIIIVPGNHDIEWIDCKGNIDTNAELNYYNFYFSFYNAYPEESFIRIGKFKINDLILGVAALNSCRLESPENAGYGYVGNEQLTRLRDYLDKNKDIDVMCVVCHHHLLPVNYVEEIRTDDKRVSIMLDAELVIRSLLDNRIRVIIHGHQHQPYYTQIRRVIPEYIDHTGKKIKLDGQLSVIGGGSCGVKQSEINVIGRHTYNLISFPDKDKLNVKTRIKSSNGIGFYDDGELIFDLKSN